MSELRPAECPISGASNARRVFVYTQPPRGEIGFERRANEPYYREVWQFELSKHFVSCHAMEVATSYTGDYVNATYSDAAGMLKTFERIIALPAEKSDNAGRMSYVRAFAEARFGRTAAIRLLDVGAGLGVFPHAVRRAGWECTALDPDPRTVKHMREHVGVNAVCGDFMTVDDLGRFDVVTLNKVLEHVPDPVAMLRRVGDCLGPRGMAYIEVPDGEIAQREGSDREEFFIEHFHVFSFVSLAMLADRAGFEPLLIERLQEPSSKYTLRAFCVPHPAQR